MNRHKLLNLVFALALISSLFLVFISEVASPEEPLGPAGKPSFSLMPPYPGLIERLRREGRPLPPFIRDPQILKSKGINQGLGLGLPAPVQPSGNYKALALLVRFTDNPSSVGASFFDTLIFGTGTGTVRDYYREVSYNTLTIVTVNLPSSIGWLTAPRTYAYYVNGQHGFGSYPQNAQKLVEDAVALANPLVDFSQYDNDGNGYVDALFVVHASQGAEFTGNPNHIWSHQWATRTPQLVDGKYVYVYSMEPEYWSDPGDMTIGVYAHELGHVFGLPDLYDYGGDSAGIGRWSLMAGGSWNGPLGSSPAHLDAWSRAQLGFVAPTIISSNTSGVSIPAVEITSTIYYLWNSGASNNEYFMVENRQQVGYDTYLPGNGLLIWHIDENMPSNDNQITTHQNCDWSEHFKVALEQADGNLDLEWVNNLGDAGDPYPGTSDNRTFSMFSIPNSGSYAACWSTVEVLNISDSGSTMTADINVTIPVGVVLLPLSQLGFGDAGTVVTYLEQVLNFGTSTDSYSLAISENTWPTTIWDATFTNQINETGSMAGGSSLTIGLKVEIPTGASMGDSDTATFTATSNLDPGVSATATFLTRVPHPILLVDDDVGWGGHHVESYYQSALTNNGYAYDYWDTRTSGSPNLSTLQAHKLVIWFTGYAWAGTLLPSDEGNLANYLDGRGRLFLSAQDYLYDVGLTSFGRDYLHIGSYTNDVETSTITGVAGNPIGDGLGPYPLSYPFTDYSDDVFPDDISLAAFTNDAGHPNALTFSDWPAAPFRTVFFGYPFEALGAATRDQLMKRIISWLWPPTFPDVSSDHWALQYIEAIYRAGITTGFPDGTYRPGEPVNRAQMATFLIRTLGEQPNDPNDYPGRQTFADVSRDYWAWGYIERLYDLGITTGYPTDPPTYGPLDIVNRAQTATFLIRALGEESYDPNDWPGRQTFSDVPRGYWAWGHIERLYDLGITTGYPTDPPTYGPLDNVNRAQMAAFLARAFLGLR